MKSISVFNNKGGVGKTTLTYHLGHALSEMGFKVLMIDADPQCNLTIYSLDQEAIHEIWAVEDRFIDEGFETTKNAHSATDFNAILARPRSLHFVLKPTEEGTGDLESLPPPIKLSSSLDILPGRLTLHLYEEKIAERWAGVYRGDPLAIRTITKMRELSRRYGELYHYDFVIIDTSPSLGSLNKVIISTVDVFFVPAAPDLFSLYGIRNIGKSLSSWKAEFNVIYSLISNEKRVAFPEHFVSFLGYTLYNAKKYSGVNNTWSLAHAHLGYAKQIPGTISEHIPGDLRRQFDDRTMALPIGELAVMHSHNTFPSMAQHYHFPMWQVPSLPNIEKEHTSTLQASRAKYEETGAAYQTFAKSLLLRIEALGK